MKKIYKKSVSKNVISLICSYLAEFIIVISKYSSYNIVIVPENIVM